MIILSVKVRSQIVATIRTFISIVQGLITVRTDALRAKILVFSFDRTPTFWAHIGRGQTIGRKMHFLTTIWTDPFFFQFRYHFHTYPLQFYCKAFYCLPLILFKSSVAKCQNENISLHSIVKAGFRLYIPPNTYSKCLTCNFIHLYLVFSKRFKQLFIQNQL